jgi:opacity protein-like surface antigen
MKAIPGLIILLTGLLCAAPVRAQEAPVLQVRTAFGASHTLHADLDYTSPALLVAFRVGRGPFAVEPEFAMAWHDETQTFRPTTSTTASNNFQSFGVNVIGRGTGRVSPYGGGGIGWYYERNGYRLNDPVDGYELSRTFGPRLGAQVVAGVDVPLTSRFKAFGQFRYEVRSFDDPGGGSVVQGFGGVAFTLK